MTDLDTFADLDIEGDDDDIIAFERSGASTFDPVLAKALYLGFCPPGGLVLDPFCGGATRGLIATKKCGLRYIGVDLNPRQIEANRLQAAAALSADDVVPDWRCADSRDISQIVNEKADFIMSCPPYVDLERYSDDPKDLSTLTYPAFRQALAAIVQASCALLKPDRFASFVVGNVRDKDGFYYPFPWHVIEAFEAVGLRLYNPCILVTPIGSSALRGTRTFEASRKLANTFQHVLIFVKGDPALATEACTAGRNEDE
jgi:hypothetical protein